MELKFIWMGNYKSIGEVTKLAMDPKVTCLIGKNESGKSNILDFISRNTLLKSISKDVYLKKHREFPEGSTSTLTFEFQLSDEEQNLLGVTQLSQLE